MDELVGPAGEGRVCVCEGATATKIGLDCLQGTAGRRGRKDLGPGAARPSKDFRNDEQRMCMYIQVRSIQ